ncbi:MAG: nitroreductase family protein [Candidatus Cloacimonetes bacterium]|nr:nitroreductase family protein [Candidatus Cloacimonadota bacterium]
MELYEIIQSRESVRDFAETAIEAEKLEIILEAGRLAPSAQNKQCWRFVVLQDKDNIKRFAKHIGLLGTVNFFIAQAPVVIVACADPKRSARVNGQEYYLVDTAISFQQMMLAAWSMGIGSCWLAAFNEKSVRQYLQIPENIRVVGLSPFGYPKEKNSLYSKAVKTFAGSRNRLELDKIITKEKWNLCR